MNKIARVYLSPLTQAARCKKPVNAEKKMTVHKAPQALCVQLKRFTPWGRKIPSPITYERRLTLAPIMSEKQVRRSLASFRY